VSFLRGDQRPARHGESRGYSLGFLVHTAWMQDTVEPSPPTPPFMVHAREVLEFSAALGVLLFVVLSVMYDEFYGPLGLEPEDVGLTQTVIVQRALAGVAAIAATGMAIVLAVLALESLVYLMNVAAAKAFRRVMRVTPRDAEAIAKWAARENWSAKLLLGLDRWSTYLPIVPPYLLLGIVDPPPAPWTHRRRWAIGVALLACATLILAFTLGLTKVRDSAQHAQSGGSVSPLTFLGIRVLDIESRSCRVNWLGTAGQRPEALSSGDLHCLGSASATAVFRTSDETIRVPASLVTISSD
jgi:hypothetical protein